MYLIEKYIFDVNKARDILNGNIEIPEGYFVHGRSTNKKIFNDKYPTEFSFDIEVAKSYSGKNGSVWIAKPKANAKVLIFSSVNSRDMNSFVANLKRIYSKDGFTNDYIKPVARDIQLNIPHELDWDTFENEIRINFCPDDIVNSAQAYDNEEWLDLLNLYTGKLTSGPDFIETPDGGVCLPGRAFKMEAYNLTELSKTLV